MSTRNLRKEVIVEVLDYETTAALDPIADGGKPSSSGGTVPDRTDQELAFGCLLKQKLGIPKPSLDLVLSIQEKIRQEATQQAASEPGT